jgi:hypothetical protein
MVLEDISKRFSSPCHFCSGIRRRLRTTQVIWSEDNVAIFGRDQKVEATSVENKFNNGFQRTSMHQRATIGLCLARVCQIIDSALFEFLVQMNSLLGSLGHQSFSSEQFVVPRRFLIIVMSWSHRQTSAHKNLAEIFALAHQNCTKLALD